MSFNKTILALSLASSAMLTGCGSTPTQYAPLTAAPTEVISNTPKWYIKPPASTMEYIYVAGSAISRDMSMSVQKAHLDAESHLAQKVEGVVSTMIKEYKRDVGDQFSSNTEVITNKVAANVMTIGSVTEDQIVRAEGGGFRTYVLLKYPLGASNQMLSQYLSKKSFTGSKEQAERELAAERKAKQ